MQLKARWQKFRHSTIGYPRPYWILFWGTLISRIGVSMVWPFLTIYMRDRLDVALATVTMLLTLEAIAGMVSTSLIGIGVDRFGRKSAMILSMSGRSVLFLLMIFTQSLYVWAVIMMLRGALEPLYRVGSQTVIADLVEPERRASAYALLRMIANLGVAIGPAIAGFLLVISYAPVFMSASIVLAFFAGLVFFFVPETNPQMDENQKRSLGYGQVLRNYPFVMYCLVFTFTIMPYLLVMTLLAVYMKDEFGIKESYFGWLMTVNAAMVVVFQFSITRYLERFHALAVLSGGAFCYALSMGIIIFSHSVEGFLLSMVVLTIGEMILMPTSTTYAANLAPLDMRGRYMSLYTLTWGAGQSIGLMIGGFLNDTFSPVAVWYGAAGMSMIATLGFVGMYWMMQSQTRQHTAMTASAMD